MTSSKNARHLALAASATLLALAAGGCVVITSDDSGSWYTASAARPAKVEEETRTSSIAHVQDSAIEIETGNGAITIEAAPDAKDVTVSAKVRAESKERLAATKVLAERTADQSLKIYVVWPDNTRKGSEGVSFEIKVPNAKGVKARSSNGALKVSGLAGKADLATSNGTVTVIKQAGPIKARSSNGAMKCEDAPAGVEVDTSNGAISVSLTSENKGPVSLSTSNGAVSLSVGRSFGGELRLKTSNGSLKIPDDVKVINKSRTKADLDFGSGEPSTVSTSNGSVTVERH